MFVVYEQFQKVRHYYYYYLYVQYTQRIFPSGRQCVLANLIRAALIARGCHSRWQFSESLISIVRVSRSLVALLRAAKFRSRLRHNNRRAPHQYGTVIVFALYPGSSSVPLIDASAAKTLTIFPLLLICSSFLSNATVNYQEYCIYIYIYKKKKKQKKPSRVFCTSSFEWSTDPSGQGSPTSRSRSTGRSF